MPSNKLAGDFPKGEVAFNFGVTLDGKGRRRPVLERASRAALIADTSFAYEATVSEGDVITAGGYRYEVCSPGATDQHLTTAGGVRLKALPSAGHYVSAEALGCEVVSTMAAAASAADAAPAIQRALDAGLDVFIPGWVRIASQLVVSGRRLIGAGRQQAGLWCSTAASGVLAKGAGPLVQCLSIRSDYTASRLLVLGGGVEGDTLEGVFDDLFVFGAKERCLLVREFANGQTRFSTFKHSGKRIGTASVEDPSRATIEIRCIHQMSGCEASAATGYAIVVVCRSDWEESRLLWIGGRIMTGYEGLIKVIGYGHRALTTAILENAYFENPGMTGNPGVNNPSLGPAIIAQGPGALIDIRSYQKANTRKASFFTAAYDGARIHVPESGAVKASALGTSQLGSLATVDVAPAPAYASGRYVSEAGALVTQGGVVYAANPAAVPFTTGASFDIGQWIAAPVSRVPGEVLFSGVPPIRSNDSEEFSLTDWGTLLRAPAIVGRLGVDFAGKQLVKTLLDGTSTAGLTLNACTAAVDSTVGEFLSGASSLALTGSAATSAANFRFIFDVPPDLVGHFLLITTAFAYKQVGATFGNAGLVRPRLRVFDNTGTAFPSSGESLPIDIATAPGAGNLTPWYKAEHLFRPLTAGTLDYIHVWDGVTGARDDICLVDNVKLWAVRSHDFGAWV